MNQRQLDGINTWFDNHVKPFLDTDVEGAKNILLKIEHTKKVCAAMDRIAVGERLSENERNIASAVALLHDAGRFTQYRRWRTFRDSESDNHARLAVDIIRSEQVLVGIEPSEQLFIEEAVRFHNLLAPPKLVASPTKLFINMIRDADKLDIWRVFTEQLALPPDQRANAATLGLPDLPDKVSAACVAALNKSEIVPLNTITCINDFIVLMVSWFYDLNCVTSRKLLAESGYIPMLAAYLPERDDIRDALDKVYCALSS